jgi:hypothetical protein
MLLIIKGVERGLSRPIATQNVRDRACFLGLVVSLLYDVPAPSINMTPRCSHCTNLRNPLPKRRFERLLNAGKQVFD